MIQDFQLDFNKNIKGNWNGGDLTSDGGLFLFHNFINQIKFPSLVEKHFFIASDSAKRTYSNPELLLQFIYMTVAGYHNQDHFDDLKNEPALVSFFDEKSLASQPTASRFINRLNETTLSQLKALNTLLVEQFYEVNPPEFLIFDIDTSYLQTHGSQEGGSYNTHYGHHGLSPLMVYDHETGLCLTSEQRPGTSHCSNGADQVLLPLLKTFERKYPNITRLLRGDSGFSAPGIYKACEDTGSKYLIKLKSNNILSQHAKALLEESYRDHHFFDNITFRKEVMYQAASWDRARRVVIQIKHHAGQLVRDITYLVTNLETKNLSLIFDLYRKRGNMENFIKEGKQGFSIGKVSQKQLVANKNQLMMKLIAYNLTRMFSALVLPEKLKHHVVETLRNKLFKVAARKVSHARTVTFKFASSFPMKKEFHGILKNIKALDFWKKVSTAPA